MTKAEKDRINRVSALGCIVCKLYHGAYSPAHIHHLTGIKYRGIGKKAKEYIPLCPAHHQNGNNEHPSIHGQPKLFNEKFGNQEFLLNQTNQRLNDVIK